MLSILYADDHVAVVDKPSGLLSCPGRGPGKEDSVQARVPLVFPHARGSILPHRLDQDTSGVMVVGLTAAAHAALRSQFEMRTTEKSYVAILDGLVTPDCGTIELSFRLDPDHRPYQVYDPVLGKPGITAFEVLDRSEGRTRVLFHPRTGRTHQLRLHAAHPLGLGSPVAGDRLYGRADSAPRLMLHAWSLAFEHPHTHERMRFQAPLPF